MICSIAVRTLISHLLLSIQYHLELLLNTLQKVLFIFRRFEFLSEDRAPTFIIQTPCDVMRSVALFYSSLYLPILHCSDLPPVLSPLLSSFPSFQRCFPPSRPLTFQGSAPFIVGAYLHNIASVELSMRRFFAIVMLVENPAPCLSLLIVRHVIETSRSHRTQCLFCFASPLGR
jgi:hypothetical protein